MEELPLETAGDQLRIAREAKGLSRGDVAASTRISERYIGAFDESRYADLPSRTYALGFTRTYARAVGLDGVAVANRLRDELDRETAQAPATTPAYMPGDPTRLPSRANLWLGGLALAIIVLLALVFWRHALAPAGELPSSLPPASPAVAPAAAPARAAAGPAAALGPAPAGGGTVVITAQTDGLWVKFSDGEGKQLMQKQMHRGETYTVPTDAKDPTVWTGAPEALAITVNGKPVPPLDTKHETVRHGAVSAAALLARPSAMAAANPSTKTP